MMTIPEIALAWLPLIDAVAKTTVILLAAAAASIVLRQASAALRHLVWTLALTSALLLPIASFALPRWQVPLLTVGAQPAPVQAVVEQTEATVAAPHPMIAAAFVETKHEVTLSTPPAAPRMSLPAAASWLDGVSWQTMLAAVWLIGAAVILARILVGVVAVRWLSRRTQEITDAAWLPMARAVAGEMGISPRLRFLRGGRASMPVAAGIFRPAVIMPDAANAWPESRLRVVLLHELAHVKRRDCLTHVLGQAACAFHWFNPLAWLAVKRARTERERACDDLVLACGTRGSDYADQLLEMARVLRGDRFPALLGGASLAMAHRSQLEGRLIAILDPRLPRSGMTRGRAFAAVALCCAAVAPLGALQPWSSRAGAPATPSAAALAVVAAETAPIQTSSPVVPQSRAGGSADRPAAPHAGEVEHEHEREAETARQVEQLHTGFLEAIAAQQASGIGVGAGIGEAAAQTTSSAVATTVVNALPFAAVHEGEQGGEKAGRSDPRMIAALTAALKDTDKEVRETAMHALVQMRDPSIFEPLVQALKDASPDVREQAAFGLGQMRDKRAVPPLIAALKDEAADVREKVVFALGQLRDPAAVEGLALAVRDANADVREQAVFALGQIRDRRAVEPLISALKDAVADVREQAAFGLGQIRDKAALDALMVAVKDTDKDVREQVVFALGQLRDPKAIDALMIALKDQHADVRRQAAFALGQIAR
jgi:HEAT repeat protein/beta-lactamase regulating signal transducer with metallopeptidase domain